MSRFYPPKPAEATAPAPAAEPAKAQETGAATSGRRGFPGESGATFDAVRTSELSGDDLSTAQAQAWARGEWGEEAGARIESIRSKALGAGEKKAGELNDARTRDGTPWINTPEALTWAADPARTVRHFEEMNPANIGRSIEKRIADLEASRKYAQRGTPSHERISRELAQLYKIRERDNSA